MKKLNEKGSQWLQTTARKVSAEIGRTLTKKEFDILAAQAVKYFGTQNTINNGGLNHQQVHRDQQQIFNNVVENNDMIFRNNNNNNF